MYMCMYVNGYPLGLAIFANAIKKLKLIDPRDKHHRNEGKYQYHGDPYGDTEVSKNDIGTVKGQPI